MAMPTSLEELKSVVDQRIATMLAEDGGELKNRVASYATPVASDVADQRINAFRADESAGGLKASLKEQLETLVAPAMKEMAQMLESMRGEGRTMIDQVDA